MLSYNRSPRRKTAQSAPISSDSPWDPRLWVILNDWSARQTNETVSDPEPP